MAGISDGFGDRLSTEEIAERLYRVSRHQVAKFHRPSDERFDDLVQEGVVAGWKAAPKATGDPVTYAAVSARRRITDVGTGKAPMLGNETGGPTYDFARRPELREDFELAVGLEAPELLAAVELAYHYDEILRVLSAMPQRYREYVYLRFWLGMTNAEVAAHRGSVVTAEKSLWQRTIRPRLAAELAHLESR